MRPALIALVIGLLMVTLASLPSSSRARTPGWAVGEHPRLMATASEKNAMIQKLTAPGTTSAALWNAFVQQNRSSQTGAGYYHYADAAILYWITGDATAGQRAHDAALNYIAAVPGGITPTGSSFTESFWLFRDLMLTYDFAYDRFTAEERDLLLRHIGMQGSKCYAAGPSWAPGNINMLWGMCAYGAAMLLENENRVDQIVDEEFFYGFGGQEKLSRPTNVSNIVISNTPGGPADYVNGVDYTTCNSPTFGDRCIDWSPPGNNPPFASTYYVSYTFTPKPWHWKSEGRKFLDYHLNYHWRDGYFAGGLHPYASVNNELLPLMIEMVSRDTGIDYRQNQDVKRQVDMYLYERLPSNDIYSQRYNTINDSSTWGEALLTTHPEQLGYRNNTRPFVAWAMSAYANDPAGYDEKYLWWWGQHYRNPDGTIKPGVLGPDWREAWYFNDALAGSYPVTTLPTPNWPKHRYFRGKEVVYSRTGDFTSSDPNAALMSFVAGPHNYQNEHDQGDAGSFTFYSLNEDWAIDPGYYDAQGGQNLFDHNAVGIDGGGYNASGIYGDPWASPAYGGFPHLGHVVQTNEGTALKAELARAWTLTDVPYVQNHERYLMMVNGNKPSYLIIGDDLNKDNANHAYDWYFHTAPGNTISTAGNVATVDGRRNNADLKIYSFASGTPVMSLSDSLAGNMDYYGRGAHKRLKISVNGVTNPLFLHLLIPTATGTTEPTVTVSAVSNGRSAIVSWPDGTVDRILWRHGAGSVNDGIVATDAKMIMTRTVSGQLTGLSMIDGRSVTVNGQTMVTVYDGTAPVTISALGSTVGVSGDDTARVSLRLPNATSASLEDGTSLASQRLGETLYINGAQPFRTIRQGGGTLWSETFDDQYPDDFYLYNTNIHPAEKQAIVDGAFELIETNYDYPSLSRRDSTPWRRSALYPTSVPTHLFGDATIEFDFKFTQTPGNRKLRFYARTKDRNPLEWVVNQDYVRVEVDPAAGTVTLGQRVNGTWESTVSNNVLTNTVGTVAASFGDTAWHTLTLTLNGDSARVKLDETELFSATLPVAVPTAPAEGFLQWQVSGTSPVLIDNLTVQSIDLTDPAPPTGGSMMLQPNGSGTVTASYGTGQSTDAAVLLVYQSPDPITPETDPATLDLIGTGGTASTANFTGGLVGHNFALGVRDQSGNISQLSTVVPDMIAPDAVTDLR